MICVYGLGARNADGEQGKAAPILVASAASRPMYLDPPKLDTPTTDEQRFLVLVNQERRARGLSRLRFDPLLCEVARAHSRDMAARKYFSHEAPNARQRTPLDRYQGACAKPPHYLLVGENLFYCSAPGVERGHKALMESPGHRKNILDGRYESAGVGSYTSDDGEYWVTQMFLKRRD